MLEITILKVEHQTAEQARKLLPYIKQCDVCGPEASDLLEKTAIENETNWEEIINSDMSRTMFTKYVWDMICKTESHPGIRAYKAKTNDYMFTEKKPLWSPERYSEEELNSLLQLKKSIKSISGGTNSQIFSGNLDAYFESCFEYYAKQDEYIAKRDRHMARQLTVAEEKIRKRYPALANKEPLKYTIFLGLAHEPERLIDIRVNVVNLGSLNAPYNRVYDAIRKGERSEELRRNILIWQHLTAVQTESLQNLEKMSLLELVALLKKDYEIRRTVKSYCQ
jgi:hypothetical protein